MAIFDTFSKRKQKLANEGKPVIYQYTNLPEIFRNQVVHILTRSLDAYYIPHGYGNRERGVTNNFWKIIFDTICREWGVFKIGDGSHSKNELDQQLFSQIQIGHTDQVLDIIDLAFRVISALDSQEDYWFENNGIELTPKQAIKELNDRFHEHNLGYQFVEKQLIQEDSQIVHHNIVEPAINLLYQNDFKGANDEYLNAHGHYRKRENSQAIIEANKAFESTMKTICEKKQWTYPTNGTAKQLLKVLFDHGLIPSELQSNFDHLQGVIESGAPTIRNKAGRAHGSGTAPIPVPDYLAAYVLHLVAANILLLMNAYLEKS